MKRLLMFIIAMMLIASIALSDIIHVPGDQPTIQAGIDAAWHGDGVLVADGTYTGDGNKNLDFQSKIIEVRSENGPEYTTIDCEGDGCGFYFHSGEGTLSIVSGFTITNANDAGIFCNHSSPTITNNIIIGNSSNKGGAINCIEKSSPIITNNIITANSAFWGGGICCNGGSCSPMITNNTIVENLANEGSGIALIDLHSSPIMINTILWGNEGGDQILIIGGTIYVTYSDVQGGWPGEGNIDANPLFVDPDSDFHLSYDSPCIGAGIMTPDVPDTDIEGNPRPNPPGSNPDMGAYENPLAEPPGSISGNVADEDTGNPITFALVIAINADTKERYKTFTDSNGDYECPQLPSATYWVICIKKGYQTGIAKVEVEPGIVTPCNFVLSRKVE